MLESFEFDPSKTVFATMEAPWELAVSRLRSSPEQIAFVQSMEKGYLDHAADESNYERFALRIRQERIVVDGAIRTPGIRRYFRWPLKKLESMI